MQAVAGARRGRERSVEQRQHPPHVRLRRRSRGCKYRIPPTSVGDPDPGSGIGCLFDPWIRDPGWEKVSIRIRDEQPGSLDRFRA